MKNLHYNFKDLFRSARLALSPQRIWINGLGLLAAYLVYLIFTYIGMMIGGHSFGSIWYSLGLLPCAFALPVPWYGLIIYILGVIISLLLILMTNTAVSRVVYMVLRDELFYSWTQAYKFAIRKWISVLGALFTFILMIAFFVIGAIVLGFIGRIPIIGELGTALFSLPFIFAALLLLFISVVFIVGLFFIPAIIATADEDALGSVFQSFRITFNQPWRLATYGLITAVLEVVGIFVLAAVVKISYKVFIKLFAIGMGSKILQIKQHASFVLDQTLPALYGWVHSLPGDLGNWIYFATHPAANFAIPGSYQIAGTILAIFLLMAGGIILAYGEAIANAGLTLIYVILYKMQENENLLEREDEELAEEESEETSTEEPLTEETQPKAEESEPDTPDKSGEA